MAMRTAVVRRAGVTAPKPLLSVEEAAELLGQSRSSIYRSISRGDLPLPVVTINGRYRIPRAAVSQLIGGGPPGPWRSGMASSRP